MGIPPTIKRSEQTPEIKAWIDRGPGYRGTHVPAVNLYVAQGPAAAILLSQIEYWFRPRSSVIGADEVQWKLRVWRDGRWWIAKRDADWELEIGLGRDQVQRALRRLRQAGFVDHRVWKFCGTKMSHVWLDVDKLAKAQSKIIDEFFDGVAGTPLSSKG